MSRQDYSLLDISDDGFVSAPRVAPRITRASLTRRAPQVSLMDDAGNTKDDMKLPSEDELAKEARGIVKQRSARARAPPVPRLVPRAALTPPRAPLQIKTGFDEGKELVVTVLKVRTRPRSPARALRGPEKALCTQAMGEEAIHAVKEGNK